jgi:hypothetical protein
MVVAHGQKMERRKKRGGHPARRTKTVARYQSQVKDQSGMKEKTVSVVLPVLFQNDSQIDLAKFAIRNMRHNTAIDFELVVIETGSRHLAFNPYINFYLHRDEKSSYTNDWNEGASAASGDFLIHTAIDVIVGANWIESMLFCFEKFSDCGVSTIAVSEPGHVLGEPKPTDTIQESFYGAIMMFPNRYKLDPAFPDQMSDYDLCLRIYSEGLKSYRNNASHAYHMKFEMNQDEEFKQKNFADAAGRFQKRWNGAPWLIARMIFAGGCKYGDEHK